jgi:hypothetical protein
MSPTDTIADADAYVDTLEVFFRYRPKGLLSEMWAILSRPVWFESCKDRSNKVQGYRLIVQHPNIAALRVLDDYQQKHRGVLCRVDIAFDFSPRPHVEANALIEWINQHVLLRWRRPVNMLDVEATLYWTRQSDRDRRSNRDIAFYSHRPSKMTGELDCIHLELRLQNASAIKREKIERSTDLIDLDPQALFRKHIRLVSYNPQERKQHVIRNTVKHDRLTYRSKQTSAFTDRYRSSIHRYANARWERAQFDRVQKCKDVSPQYVARLATLPMNTINVADCLSWRGGNRGGLIDKGNLGRGG